MSDINLTSLKERLWQKMQGDLAQFMPDVVDRDRLMCCACGRFLPPGDFDVDHMIPRRALRCDPDEVRNNPETPTNTRAGTILLCKKPLHYRNSRLHNNGCNSWKGKHFDGPMSDILTGRVAKNPNKHVRTSHIIGGISLAYLAMVAEFGYIVALMQSGRVLREQFFNPSRMHRALGTKYQIILTGEPQRDIRDPIWAKPFNFEFQDLNSCIVTVRNYVVYLPISHNPTMPIARHLPYVPQRYAFRPNFDTSFT